MASFSPYSFCVFAYTPFCSSNFSNRSVYSAPVAQFITNQPSMTRPISIQPTTYSPSEKRRHCFSLNSSYSSSNFTLSIRDHFAKPWIENAIKLLIGSLMLIGSRNIKPAIALPVKNSVIAEEERETQKGKMEENEEMYMKLLEEEPRNVDALKVLVNGKMRRGKMKEAVKYVEMLINIEPDEVEWKLLQALCYEMMGQIDKAKRLFMEILKEQPLLLKALHGLALVMHKNLEGPAVFEMLNKALDLARRKERVNEERNIRILIAQMHVIKGELDEGLKEFQDLVNDNPRDFRPYLCQGIIYSLQDKKKEAEEQFELYQSLVPDEFPQRRFLDDVMLTARTESRQQLEKQFISEFSYKK